MNLVKLYLGNAYTARIVRALPVSGDAGFSEIKTALEADEGPTPMPSVLSRALRALIAAKVVAKGDQGRYSLSIKDGRVAEVADLVCAMEADRPK